MKHWFFYSVSFLLLSLMACENDVIEEAPKKIPLDLGYFKGSVNDLPVSVENTPGGSRQSGWRYIDRGGYVEVGAELKASYWTIPIFAVRGSLGDYFLKILLLPLKEGEFLIDRDFHSGIELYSTIRVVNSMSKQVYVPLKAPFKVQVDSIRFRDSFSPYIEGKMEGVLYNKEDLNDSIVIKDVTFGIH